MQLGIHLPHVGRKAGPETIRRGAEQAEALGYDDVWTSEHIIVPKDAPYPPSAIFYEPVMTLLWAAAFTKRVRLGTSVLVLPMRHPIPLAKELATVQNLSGGRLILGAGVGWMEAEFSALGVPFKERGRRMDEGLAMMNAVWNDDPISFDAKYIPAVIQEMRMLPKPVAPIPVWIGGRAEVALARATRVCQGWHGSRYSPEEVKTIVERLRRDRPEPEFTISMRSAWDGKNPDELRARVAAYQDAGVQHVMIEPFDRSIEDWMGTVERGWKACEGI